ncbi:MAG: ankyrin repeat domain-containing protein [Sandaracinus sp.]
MTTMRERRFTWSLPGGGQERWLHADVHRGGVIFTEETSNPNHGGLASAGARSFDDVIGHGVPEVSEDDARALIEHLRACPRQPEGDPSAWDPEGVSVLAHAAGRGDADAVRALLARGARADEPCRDGTRPLSFAVSALGLEAIEALVSAGAKVEDELLSAAFWAKGPDDRRAACLARLAASGARATTELVWRAASFGRVASLRVLLASGGDPRARTRGGDLALVDGARHHEVVTLLLGAGAVVTDRDAHGRSPLEFAIACGKPEAALLLLARGAWVGLSPKERASARSLAVDRGLADVVAALEARGD